MSKGFKIRIEYGKSWDKDYKDNYNQIDWSGVKEKARFTQQVIFIILSFFAVDNWFKHR